MKKEPGSPEKVRSLAQQQFHWLMEGLAIAPEKSVRPVEKREAVMNAKYVNGVPRYRQEQADEILVLVNKDGCPIGVKSIL